MPTTPSRGSFGSAEPDAGNRFPKAEVRGKKEERKRCPRGLGHRRLEAFAIAPSAFSHGYRKLLEILCKAELPTRIIYVRKHHKVMRKSRSSKTKVVD